MNELGNRLREAREKKQLTIEDIQAVTKIQPRYLVGIEEGNLSILPGKFYVKAFVRQYAEAVDLDPEELYPLLMEEEIVEQQPEQPEEDTTRSKRKKSKPINVNDSKWMELAPKIFLALVIVGALFGLWKLIQMYNVDSTEQDKKEVQQAEVEKSDKIKENEKKTTDEEQPVEEGTTVTNADGSTTTTKPDGTKTTKAVDGTVIVEEKDGTKTTTKPDGTKSVEKPDGTVTNYDADGKELPKQQLTLKPTTDGNLTYDLTGATTFKVAISATEDSWLTVEKQNGERLYYTILKADKPFEADLTAEQLVNIKVGRPGVTTIKINDEAIVYPDTINKGAPQRFIINNVKTEQ